jgi:GPH family glycoside/pentoside/hexuronide:cation symporter
VGWALAAFFAFKLLSFTGFQANVIPSVEVKNSLVQLMSLIPAVLGIVSIVIFLFYPLTDARVNEMNEELKARRIKAGVPVEV